MVKRSLSSEKQEMDEAYNKAMNWFFSFPEREFGLTELSERLGISKTTANKTIRLLEEEGFVNIDVIGRVWRISCNVEHRYNYTRKIAYNLIRVYESGIIEEIHKRFQNPRAIILFGSYRKGDDNEKSDIDVAIEVLGNSGMRVEELGVIENFGYRENVTVNMIVFSRKNVDTNLFTNIANGILLEGVLEVKP